MTLQEQFEAAKADSKNLSEKPNNEILLQLYSLYKQGTEGDATNGDDINAFDFVAKAKYNAWETLKGTSKEIAMKAYVDLVNKLKG